MDIEDLNVLEVSIEDLLISKYVADSKLSGHDCETTEIRTKFQC